MNININTILMVCSIITSVSGASAVIIKTLRSWSNKLTDKVKEEIKEEIEEELVNPLKEEFTSEYNVAVNDFNNKLDSVISSMEETKQYRHKKESDEKNFRLATLKGLIVSAHGTYMPRGTIDTHVYSTIEDIYDEYKNLGGNHFIANLMEDLNSLEKI
jgi:hypothetical protein